MGNGNKHMSASNETTRQQFMASISEALGRKKPLRDAPTPPAVDDAIVRLAGEHDGLVEMFIERAGEVGMTVHRCKASDVGATFEQVLKAIEAETLTLADSTPYRDELMAVADKANVELLSWRDDREMVNHYRASAGVCGVHAALAETGSMICNTDADSARGHSLVPARHIAIVRTSDILPDLLDYMRTRRGIAPADLPSAQAIITGPSKTADIEGILITGVHGPGAVDILLVDDAA